MLRKQNVSQQSASIAGCLFVDSKLELEGTKKIRKEIRKVELELE